MVDVNEILRMNETEIIRMIAQSAIIEQILEKRMVDKLSSPDYRLKDAMKRLVVEVLDDYSVKDKIKRIATSR